MILGDFEGDRADLNSFSVAGFCGSHGFGKKLSYYNHAN